MRYRVREPFTWGEKAFEAGEVIEVAPERAAALVCAAGAAVELTTDPGPPAAAQPEPVVARKGRKAK